MELLGELAKTGILGLLLAMAIGAIIFLYNENKRLQQEKFDIAKEYNTLYLNMANKTVDTLSSLQKQIEIKNGTV